MSTNRERIYGYIERNPGLHLREIHRRLDIPLSTIEYHVESMSTDGMICVMKDGIYSRYYVKAPEEETHNIISCLRKDRTREILSYCLEKEKTGFKQLSDHIRINDSTLSYHLKNLTEKGVLHKKRVKGSTYYHVTQPEKLTKILTQYMYSFNFDE